MPLSKFCSQTIKPSAWLEWGSFKLMAFTLGELALHINLFTRPLEATWIEPCDSVCNCFFAFSLGMKWNAFCSSWIYLWLSFCPSSIPSFSSHLISYLLVACIFLSLATFARKKDDGMMFYGNLLFSSLCFQVTE